MYLLGVTCTHLYKKNLWFGGRGSTSSISLSTSAEYPFQSAFIKLKTLSGRYSLRYHNWVGTNTDRVVLGVWDRVHDLLITHIRDTSICKYEIWAVAFLPSCTVEGFR